jgi:hypothetical protein
MRHRFHALCPYFAMFPEQFAAKWIERLTAPGDYVLDPFSGRGTTALSAVLLGRHAISSDTNDVAYCLTLAKTNPPQYRAVRNRVRQLKDEYCNLGKIGLKEKLPLFFKWAFSTKTLPQLVFLRDRLRWRSSRIDAMVAALVLGSLHGESRTSRTYLSNQMPRTISTKPDYSVRFWSDRDWHPPSRDVFDLIEDRLDYRYVSSVPKAHSLVFHADMRKLPYLLDQRKLPVGCVITSPPYMDVTNFEEDQWLRLWLLGGPPYPTRNRLNSDDRHTGEDKYWSFIADMWRSLGAVLKKNSHIVLRVGSRRQSPDAIRNCLRHTSGQSGRNVRLVSSRTSEIRNRQTRAFSPGSLGCLLELDCHFVMR